MRLRTAMIYVFDLPRMRGFYGAFLAVKTTTAEMRQRYALLDAGGVELALHAVSHEVRADAPPAAPAVARENVPVKLIFAVDDVAEVRARLVSLGGVAVTREWQDPQFACDIIDPEGNVFQISAPS